MTGEAAVALTPLEDRDRDALFEWINDEDLVVLSAPFTPIQRADHERWFRQIRSRDDVAIYAIRTGGPGGPLIGSCQLNSMDKAARSADLQIRIGDRSAWGQGLGTEAVRQLLSKAFSEFGLERVELDVFEDNERAVRAYEKAGFKMIAGAGRRFETGGRERVIVRMGVDLGTG